MLIITYERRPAAIVVRNRAYLLPSAAMLEVDHPRRRWVTCIAFFVRDVVSGKLDGPYTARRAEHFARCALMPEDEFLPLERYPEAVVAEYFNVPIEQVAERRADIEAARTLASMAAVPSGI